MGRYWRIYRQWTRHQSPLVTILLAFSLFLAPLIGSVKRTHDTIDLFVFGSGSSIICVSTDGVSEPVPDQGEHNHHERECCVLCAVDHGRGNVDVTLLPYTAAYPSIQRTQPFAILNYFVPDIALSDGVFPFDVPARAPPFLAA